MNKFLIFMAITASAAFPASAENLEKQLEAAGLTDITALAPDIAVSLMYARPENFTGTVLYEDLNKAYLHPRAAKALAAAQKELAELRPGHRLLVKDAARPMSVQRKMFKAVQGSPKANYVANPAKGGGLHNYGMAVDITIVGPDGKELPMGTPVDHLGPEANINREAAMVKEGTITEEERQNRILLRNVMRHAGFTTIRTEWWHFNFVSKSVARTRYRLLDF